MSSEESSSSFLMKRTLSSGIIDSDCSEPTLKSPRVHAVVQQTNLSDGKAMTNVDKLEALIATFYPQYARVRYIPLRVNLDEGSTGRLKQNETPSSELIRYRCKVFFFEMYIECRDLYITFEEAREAVARIALDLLTEFNTVIRSRSTDARFGPLFQPLLEEMTKNLAKHTIDSAEEERLSHGHDPILSVENYKEVGSLDLQKGILSASLSAIYEKMSAPGVLQPGATAHQPTPAVVKSTNVQPTKTETKTDSPIDHAEDTLMDPLSAIYVHYQKRAATTEAPDFQVFDGKTKNLFGCIGKYDGKSYIAEGVYRTKKDAKRAAAVLMCQELFGMNCPVAGGDSTIATNDAVSAISTNVKETITKVGQGAQLPVEKVLPSPEKLAIEPPVGKRFVSMVNECCQVNRLPQPDYQCQTGDSINSYYIIHAPNLFDHSTILQIGGEARESEELPKRFVSAAFTRKADAKEDCAARFFAFLKEHGLFDEAGNLKRKTVAPDSLPPYRRAGGGRYFNSNHTHARPQPPPHQQRHQPQPHFIPPVPAWPPVGMPMGMPPFPFPPIPPPLPGSTSANPATTFPPPPPLPPNMMPPPFPMMFPPFMNNIPFIMDPSQRPAGTPGASNQPAVNPFGPSILNQPILLPQQRPSPSSSSQASDPRDPRRQRQ